MNSTLITKFYSALILSFVISLLNVGEVDGQTVEIKADTNVTSVSLVPKKLGTTSSSRLFFNLNDESDDGYSFRQNTNISTFPFPDTLLSLSIFRREQNGSPREQMRFQKSIITGKHEVEVLRDFNVYGKTTFRNDLEIIPSTIGSPPSKLIFNDGSFQEFAAGTKMDGNAIVPNSESSKAFMFPRGLTGTVFSPIESMLMYDTLQQEFKYFDGSFWQDLDVEEDEDWLGGSGNYYNLSARFGIGTSAPSTDLHISKTNDVSLTSNGILQLGPTNTENIAMDQNEIQARNDGAASDLSFNIEGGDINFGSGVVTQEYNFRRGDLVLNSLTGADFDFGVKWAETSIPVFGMTYDGAGSETSNRLHLREYFGDQSDIMTFKGNGFIGVNQPDPQQLLHISRVDQIGAAPKVLFTNGNTGTTSSDGFEIGLDPNVGPPPLGVVTNTARIWNNEDAGIEFGTNDQHRMIIANDGQVGIGTDGPVDSKIHIHKASAGDIPAKIRFTDDVTGIGTNVTVAGFEVGLTTNQDGALLHAGAKDILFITDNLDEQMRIKDNGNVIVYDQLSVGNSATQGATLQVDSNTDLVEDPLRVRVGSSTKFMVHDNGSISMGTSGAASANNVRIVGRLGIGDSTPDVELDVVGDINYTGTIADVSDIRLKKNIVPIKNALSRTLNMRGVYYDHREVDGFEFSEEKQIGVIAQEVEAVFPELVRDAGDGYKAVDYVSMNAVLIEAIREQQVMIDELRREIDELKKR